MSTKNDKYSFIEHSFTTSENRYYNLNLNQSGKSATLIPVQSNSTTNNDKCCGIAAAAFIVSGNYEEKEKLWNGPFKTFLTLNEDNDYFKKRWKNENVLNTVIKSTLSLHISANENSFEAAASDLFGDEYIKGLKKEKLGLIKTSKQCFTDRLKFKNAFEFQRQQNDGVSEPEVCQFKASQRLVYPNEASNNSEQPKKKAFSFESDAESENEFFDASDVIDTVEDTVVVEDTAVVEDTVVVEDTAVVEDTVVPISYSSPSRHKRKRINLNSSAESSNTGNNNDVNDIHDLDEPLPKRKRGKAPIYEFLRDAASLEELNALAKEAELTLKEDKGRSVLFKCKYPQCGYKWKAKITDDLIYKIFETETEHRGHGDSSLNGISDEMKKIIDKRIVGNEAINPESCLQAFRNHGFRVLPTNLQVKNYIAYHKKVLLPKGGNLNFLDLEQMVQELGDDPKKYKFWFAQNGTAYRCNNGMEVTNKWIKVDFITQKAPLMRGITLLEKFLVRMRDKNFGSVEVRITDKDWVAAFDFKRVTSIFHDEDEHMYYLRRSNSELDDDQFQALVEMLDSDVFTSENVKEFQDNVVVIDESKVFDGVLTCNCPLGAQRKICKHVIVIEVKKKRRQFTSIEARRQQLTECGRNRAGRPKKHGPALSFK